MREQAVRKREAGQQAAAALSAVEQEIAQAERDEQTIYERMIQP